MQNQLPTSMLIPNTSNIQYPFYPEPMTSRFTSKSVSSYSTDSAMEQYYFQSNDDYDFFPQSENDHDDIMPFMSVFNDSACVSSGQMEMYIQMNPVASLKPQTPISPADCISSFSADSRSNLFNIEPFDLNAQSELNVKSDDLSMHQLEFKDSLDIITERTLESFAQFQDSSSESIKKTRLRRGSGTESQKKDPNDNFYFENKPCFIFIQSVARNFYKKKCTTQFLQEIAGIVEELNPKIRKRTRMEKRRKNVLYSWFHRNWPQISKLKGKIIIELQRRAQLNGNWQTPD